MILVALNNARSKSRIASGQTTISGLKSAFSICADYNSGLGSNLRNPDSNTAGGGNICNGESAQWPQLPAGWQYNGQGGGNSATNPSWNFTCDSTNCGVAQTATCNAFQCIFASGGGTLSTFAYTATPALGLGPGGSAVQLTITSINPVPSTTSWTKTGNVNLGKFCSNPGSTQCIVTRGTPTQNDSITFTATKAGYQDLQVTWHYS